jgi:cytochrome c oxidase accessory protein FixG
MKKIPVVNVTPPKKTTPNKIQVHEVKGIYQRIRLFTGWGLLALYFGTVWLQWDGRQAVLFDLPERQFHIFSLTLWPQDFVLLTGLLMIAAFALFTVTTFAGRLWCGYTCPQTIWTFMFMWVEERLEGPRHKRIKMDARPMDLDKFWRRSLKHFIWILIGLFTGITFIGYFTPIGPLISDLVTFQANSAAVFWISFFTLATYGNAGWLREQVCIHMCPYARFQAVMFDHDTLIVSYDEKRGEGEKGRGPRKRNIDHKAQGLGDCIDCDLCVHVCPTGIDIREGLQYECIDCALCIDACDTVMEKMNYEKGLIRYTTEHALQGKKTHILRPRLIGYAAILTFMVTGFFYTLLSRSPVEIDVIRDRGALFQQVSWGIIQNNYVLKLVNKQQYIESYKISVSGPDGLSLIGKSIIEMQPNEIRPITVSLRMEPDDIKTSTAEVVFSVQGINNPDLVAHEDSRFLGPVNYK